MCALPMVNLGKLDSDWYEGITQKLKWNVPIREERSQEQLLASLRKNDEEDDPT